MRRIGNDVLRLGTRGSKLAIAQAESIKARIERLGAQVQIVPIKTSGDKGLRTVLGAFVREIQQAVLEGKVDLAQHCLKDLPTSQGDELTFGAYLEREDPADVLISRARSLDDLPEGSLVGTGSVRRTSQIAHTRPDLSFKPLTGNVDTRLRKLAEREYDAIVLAIAGLNRLGLEPDDSIFQGLFVQKIPVSRVVPAPGQGVIVLECRADNRSLLNLISRIHHEPTRRASTAERAFLARFGGGCSVPVAALATVNGVDLELTGRVCSPDGGESVQGSVSGSEPFELGTILAERLGEQGAFEIYARSTVGDPVI